MRLPSFIVLLAFALCACSKKPVQTTDPILEKYVDRYCDETGNLGIGFLASDTYNFKYRQLLKKSPDAELRRLYVLWLLYDEMDSGIRDFERGVVNNPREKERPMTAEERGPAHASITERLDDLSHLDPRDPEGDIAEFRERLSRTVEAGPK